MDSQAEQRLMQAMYDRIYDMLTYSPGPGRGPIFSKQTTLLQLATMGAGLNPANFANAVSPAHPTGDLLSSENFSRLVDPVPAIGALYNTTTVNVESTYGQMINGANVTTDPVPAQVAKYEQAFKYLNTTTEITAFDGTKTTQTGPSQILQTYQTNQLAYQTAVSNFRLAFLSYDMSKPSDQQKWQAQAGVLQAAMDQAYNNWRNQGAAQVEQAQNVLATTINDGARSVIADAQRIYAQSTMAGQFQGDTSWHLSYGMPSNWGDPNPITVKKLFAHYDISTSNLNTSSSSDFTSYGGGAGFSLGLFSIGGSYDHSTSHQRFHMDATDIHVSMDICVVQIVRPWLNGLVFNTSHWYNNAFNRGGISTGNLLDHVTTPMKLIPTAFVVARNIVISGNFSQSDMSRFTQHDSAGGSFGWGPFQIGGHYSRDKSGQTFSSTVVPGKVTVPGMQIIAWVSQIVPFCPPNDAPGNHFNVVVHDVAHPFMHAVDLAEELEPVLTS